MFITLVYVNKRCLSGTKILSDDEVNLNLFGIVGKIILTHSCSII